MGPGSTQAGRNNGGPEGVKPRVIAEMDEPQLADV